MTNRIVGLNGLPAGDSEPSKQLTMKELLDQALKDHYEGRKDKAFIAVLNGIARTSDGIFTLGQLVQHLEKQYKVVAEHLVAAQARIAVLEKHCGIEDERPNEPL